MLLYIFSLSTINRYDAKQKAVSLCTTFGIQDYVLLELDAVDASADMISKKIGSDSLALASTMIFVDGGNTFYLQKHIQNTCFWEIINPILSIGGLYVGQSAGAIVAGTVNIYSDVTNIYLGLCINNLRVQTVESSSIILILYNLHYMNTSVD